MKKLVILRSERFEESYKGPESQLTRTIRQIPNVADVRISMLYSLQVDLLPDDNNWTVIIVDMALRYDNVQKWLANHNQRLIEMHSRPGRGGDEGYDVEVKRFVSDDDLVTQIAAI